MGECVFRNHLRRVISNTMIIYSCDFCDDENNFRYVYWGEYPLTFAACLGQEECYRLMLSRGADPDAQDTNGNTVLHLLVIHKKLVLFFSLR